jgi:hypothetical protein
VLGKQFVTLYRGITDTDGAGINTRSLGQHWSEDRSVAERFASFDEDGYDTPGFVMTANVHRRHVVQPGSLEYRRMQADQDLHSPASYERERPLRKGAIVHVSGIAKLDVQGESSPVEVSSVFGNRRVGRA